MIPKLDRLVPSDWKHVERHPMLAHAGLATILATQPQEVLLNIPRQYRDEYDQGSEGACVGYSQSWMMSILNRLCYDAYRLYATAQGIDEWISTPPAEGTSLRAGFDVLRTIGHWRVRAGVTRAPMLVEGIVSNTWARQVDDIRAALASGTPVNFGINWYRQFSNPKEGPRYGDRPTSQRREYIIGPSGEDWGPVDGGHAITCVGFSDKRQAFALCNTWGYTYPFIVWLPYASFARLIGEDGEAGIVADRIKAA